MYCSVRGVSIAVTRVLKLYHSLCSLAYNINILISTSTISDKADRLTRCLEHLFHIHIKVSSHTFDYLNSKPNYNPKLVTS